MINVFRFSNWNQLSGLNSVDYPNLTIHVSQFNSEDLVGTKIDIVDSENHIIYFSGFIRTVLSNRFNILATYDVNDMIKRINSYGFNIEIIEPITLPPNVITMLQGLFSMGYEYITLEYAHEVNTSEKSLYQPNIDNAQNPLIDSIKGAKVYNNKYIVATKHLSDVRRRPPHQYEQPTTSNIFIVSKSPDFNWEDFKWAEPTRVYSIEKLLNPNTDTSTPISDAIVNGD